MLRGARMSAKVVDTQHRRSLLVQGGLDVQIEVTVTVDCTEKCQLDSKKYESLLCESYKELVEGRFGDATTDILSRINLETFSFF